MNEKENTGSETRNNDNTRTRSVSFSNDSQEDATRKNSYH